MILFQAKGISKEFGDKKVLKSISFNLKTKEIIGLIGVNGSGKTTLLKCLTGQMSSDSGEIYWSDILSIGYLEQLSEPAEDITAWDLIMNSFSELIDKRRKLSELEKAMANGESNLNKLMERYARLTEEYEKANGYTCENTARRILVGLGFTAEQFTQNLKQFSGGEKTCLNLGRILAAAPDVLFLDEPTNHLDMDAVEWLEEYLGNYQGAVLVVSHDRMFLERIATRIIELKNGQVMSYSGGYVSYLKQKALNEKALHRAYEKQQEYIQKTDEYIRRFKAGIKSKQARGRELQLKRLEKINKPVIEKNVGVWNFPMHSASGQDVLRIKNLCKSFNNHLVLEGIELSLQKGDKVALIGPNGSGKSTLLKIINGLVEADRGEIAIGQRVKIGYLSQEYEDLNPENTVIKELIDHFDIDIPEARNLLGRMLFTGDDVFKPVFQLSGGEKGRLSLLKLILTGANFLMLDEPTNHLDIESRQTVENILCAFPGTIMMVSHDRYFIDRVAKRVVAIENKKLEYYWGNYSYYREKFREKEERKEQEQRLSQRKSKSWSYYNSEEKERQRLHRRLKKQLENIELQISSLEDKKRQLETYLSDPETYHNAEKSRFYTREYKETEEMLTDAYESWVNISEQL